MQGGKGGILPRLFPIRRDDVSVQLLVMKCNVRARARALNRSPAV